MAIHNRYEAGRFSCLHTPMAILAIYLDRLGPFESAATYALEHIDQARTLV